MSLTDLIGLALVALVILVVLGALAIEWLRDWRHRRRHRADITAAVWGLRRKPGESDADLRRRTHQAAIGR